MVDYLIKWLIDWLLDLLNEWLIDRSIDSYRNIYIILATLQARMKISGIIFVMLLVFASAYYANPFMPPPPEAEVTDPPAQGLPGPRNQAQSGQVRVMVSITINIVIIILIVFVIV